MDIRNIFEVFVCLYMFVMGTESNYEYLLGYNAVTMVTRSDVYDLHKGQSAELPCEFHMEYFDFFDNPIVWKKAQLDEETQINTGRNVMEPFDEIRFKMTLIAAHPNYKVLLTIKDATYEDYGNYTCEVRAKDTTVLASVTYYVYVRAPVHSISISDGLSSDLEDGYRTMYFKDKEYAPLYCTSLGGCPPPKMAIYLGEYDITSQFLVNMYSKYSGHVGMRRIEHVTVAETDTFPISAEMDNQNLRCVVTVPGLGSNKSMVRIRVTYAPIIKCAPTHASLNEKNVSIVCEVRSRPITNALFWIIDTNGTNGTTVSNNNNRNEYWTSNRDRNDGVLETRFYIKRVSRDNFRTYTVVAENIIGTKTKTVTLLQKALHSEPQHSAVEQVPDSAPSDSPHMSYSTSSAWVIPFNIGLPLYQLTLVWTVIGCLHRYMTNDRRD